MRFELGHVPMPEGYGDGIMPLDACKAHLRVTRDSENELIAALRDAAIEYVERFCGLKLGPQTGLTWRAERLPQSSSVGVDLAVRPIAEISSIVWRDAGGASVTGDASDLRVTEAGVLRPAIGKVWPSGIAGDVVVTFSAGYASGEAPPSLLSAVKLMLGHLFMNREAVVSTGVAGEVPFGVAAMCASFRPVVI
ncbi:MAG: hypothetical protein CMI67_25945 [Pelagibaca sp.]|nr:hypothetical protein [Pelagibaca sp.]|tara:strand:- start:181 stop:762 length:582 start_codon:yes stop_codon:yes gene_type:complete